MPGFTRTNAAVFRRRYRAACPSRVDEILASYDDAIETSTRATRKLDDLALVLDAPTWPLATLRAQPRKHPARLPAQRDVLLRGLVHSPPRPRSVGARAYPPIYARPARG